MAPTTRSQTKKQNYIACYQLTTPTPPPVRRIRFSTPNQQTTDGVWLHPTLGEITLTNSSSRPLRMDDTDDAATSDIFHPSPKRRSKLMNVGFTLCFYLLGAVACWVGHGVVTTHRGHMCGVTLNPLDPFSMYTSMVTANSSWCTSLNDAEEYLRYLSNTLLSRAGVLVVSFFAYLFQADKLQRNIATFFN